jgi:hypothetical protein
LVPVKATLLVRDRIAHSDDSFSEIVVWQVPEPLTGSLHGYKYRLAFVQRGECVLRYDNEAGKGDHRHSPDGEARYRFTTLDRLFADFESDVERILHEDSDS